MTCYTYKGPRSEKYETYVHLYADEIVYTIFRIVRITSESDVENITQPDICITGSYNFNKEEARFTVTPKTGNDMDFLTKDANDLISWCEKNTEREIEIRKLPR